MQTDNLPSCVESRSHGRVQKCVYMSVFQHLLLLIHSIVVSIHAIVIDTAIALLDAAWQKTLQHVSALFHNGALSREPFRCARCPAPAVPA